MSSHNELAKEFNRAIESIFDKNLVFGFICGSYASHTATKSSDIDIFICVKTDPVPDKYIEDFLNLYLRLHEKYNYTPDMQYPGELMSENELQLSLQTVIGTVPKIELDRKDVYDAITWAGMLYSKSNNWRGNRAKYKQYKSKSKVILGRWVSELGAQVEHFKEKDKILKEIIIYKHDV